MPIALILHGGAGVLDEEQRRAAMAGCEAALATGWSILEQGGSALEACTVAVKTLEDNPLFNAGVGAVLNAAGEVELDAAIMDGKTLGYGAVGAVRRVRNPIILARSVLESAATLLVGAHAEAFAARHNIPLCDNRELIVAEQRRAWEHMHTSLLARVGENGAIDLSEGSTLGSAGDTVGAIALDRAGNLIAANSTGGMRFKIPGRVGDVPMIGAGLYADAAVGACVCTGWGEAIARMALSRRGVELLEQGHSPQKAAEHMLSRLACRVPGGRAGCILLNPQGQVGAAWNTETMSYAYRVA